MFINPAGIMVSVAVNRLAKLLIEEYAVLGDSVRHVEWIEKELRSMQGLLEQVEQRGDGEQEQALKEWADELKNVVREANNVIETFVIKSTKRWKWGVLYWNDKYKVGKELVHIRNRMKDISRTGIHLNTGVTVSVSVETTSVVGEASSSSSTSVVVPSLVKLPHILNQPIVTGAKVMEMVELVLGELVRLQSIVSNLRSASETENMWLEEVKGIFNYTESAAENFILVKERLSKMGWLQKALYLFSDYASENVFQEKMNYVRTQIGDAVRRSLTYGVGGQLDTGAGFKQTRPTSLPNMSLNELLIGDVFSSCLAFVKLWSSVDKNLECVQKDLDLMHAFLRDTEQAGLNLNERQKVWVSQLRHVAQNTQSFFDAYSKAGRFSRLIIRRTKLAQDINWLLKEILSISDRKDIYCVANIIFQGTSTTQQELVVATTTGPIIQEEREIQREIESPPAAASYQPVTGLKEKVQSMRAGMKLMDALFQDVNKMGREKLDSRSKIWVEQMESIDPDARTAINEYVTKLEKKSFLNGLLRNSNHLLISRNVDYIRNKLEDATRRRKAYGLVEIQSRVEPSSMVQILRGRTLPSVAANRFSVVGFDDDAQVLIAQLLSDEQRRCITCIVGIEGIGKTALARFIFQHNAVVGHFQHRIWVSLPSNCTAEQLLKLIAKKAAEEIRVEDNDLFVLATLACRKYLVVVDGIEETSQVYFNTLNRAIPDRSTGSRLLLNCRNTNVARNAGGNITYVHPLELLDDETSWELFRTRLRADITPELIKDGREFVIKCGGLPSQILKLSDMFSRGEGYTREDCLRVLNQIHDPIQSWSLTLKAINTDLPLYLRRCLSYFGLFPADFGIPVRRLVVLWVAESLVHHSEQDQEPPEQVAERYLTKLIDRNMVQVATRKRNGKVKTCRLPNALRQLWLTDADHSKKSIIRWVADNGNRDDILHNHIHGDTSPISSSLSTHYKDVLSFLSFDTQEGSKPGQQVGNFLKGCISSDCFLLLRVLDLERVYKPKLPKRIKRLTQLRYLGLRWTYLDSLPSSISSLLKLQTLDLKHTYIHTLPTSIWKMELRHLFLSETYRTKVPPQPKDNSLSDLQTLSGLFVDEETPMKNGLDKLVNIKKLGLACQSMSLQPEAMRKQLKAVADWITKLNGLQSLKLKSRDEEGKPWILDLNSLVNHTNLTDIYLLGSLSSSNVLSQFPLSLVEITLSHSELEDDPMILLKDFPHLRTLCLLAESYAGTTVVCESQSFPQLHVLKFWKLWHLEEIKIEPGALPCLRQLEIRSCPNLQMLPDGLKHVSTLLELKLTNMPMEMGADMHNILPNCQVIRHNFQ